MKKGKKAKFPLIKKDIVSFINEEEGAISKKDALHLGLSLVMLGTVLKGSATAQTTHSSTTSPHNSALQNLADRGVHSSNTPHTSHGVHASHANHANHANHSAHSNCHSNSCHSNHGSHGSHGSCHSNSCHGDNCFSW